MHRRFVFALFVAACGGGGGDGGSDAPDGMTCLDTGRYLGLATGQSWTYKVTDTMTHTVSMKTQVVGALEPVTAHAGISAYKLSTTKSGGSTDSWQEDTGTEVRRHAEVDTTGASVTSVHFDPYRIRIDETTPHLAAGAAWVSNYDEVTSVDGGPATTVAKVENWSIVAVQEMVTVPSGTFCALHIHRTATAAGAPGSTKDYWFTRNVGKVKEVGDGQTEELTAFTR